MKNIKTALIGLGVVLFGIGLYFSLSYINTLTNDGRVIISTNQPTIASYIYNSGSEYYGLGSGDISFSIKPGNYTVLFDYNNNLQYKNITVIKGKVLKVFMSIKDNNIKSENTSKLIQLLPYYGPGFEYSVTYSYDFSSGVAVPVITLSYTTPQSLSNALSWFSHIGINTSLINLKTVQV